MFNVYNLMHLDIHICLLYCHHSRVVNISSSSKSFLVLPFFKGKKALHEIYVLNKTLSARTILLIIDTPCPKSFYAKL